MRVQLRVEHQPGQGYPAEWGHNPTHVVVSTWLYQKSLSTANNLYNVSAINKINKLFHEVCI